MEDIDIWKIAAQFIENYGEDAGYQALVHADELFAADDEEGSVEYLKIMAAIEQLELDKLSGV